MPAMEEADLDDSEEASLISLAKVSEVVNKLLRGKVPSVSETHPDML